VVVDTTKAQRQQECFEDWPYRGKMVKSKRPKSSTSDTTDVLAGMPIASALQNNDTAVLASSIESALAGNDAIVSDIIIEKTSGEAFTGGRSTPVYHVTCLVQRPGMKLPRRRNFVAKLVVMEGDEADAKVGRRRESYAVERRFYDAAAPRLRDGPANLTVPRLLASDRDGSRPWPAVCFLMNDLRAHGFPRHPDFLSVEDVARALRWLAAFHANFFGDAQSEDWRRDLWGRGGFWTGGKDCDGNGIAAQWTQTVRWMQSSHPEWASTSIKNMGQRIQVAAGPVTNFLFGESKGSRGTLIHGDYKAANLFFSNVNVGCNGNGEDSGDGTASVAAVDFQFSGAGLGAEDVAYLLFPDARGHYFDHEEMLLKVYHDEFISCLINQRKGGPSSLSFATFNSFYKLSQLDFTRHLLGKGWVGSTIGDARLVSALNETLRSIDNGDTLGGEGDYMEGIGKMIRVEGQ